MRSEPQTLDLFTASCIGAIGACAVILWGWRATDAALRRVRPRKPGRA